MSFYRQLVIPSHNSPSPPFTLTERHLQILWLEQKFLFPLLSSKGQPVKVISPGIWNNEAGPDFLKAHLKIGDYFYRGDIEIHLHSQGWLQHKHHEDPRYNRVILHLVFWIPSKEKTHYKENGQSFFVCYLQNSLTLQPHQIVNLINLELYPSKKFSGNGRCADQLFQTLSAEAITTLFRSAAYWRFERKAQFLENNQPEKPLQFATGIAMALGYKHNSLAFLDLFLYLLPYRDLPYDQLLALAYGCCGFFEVRYQKRWQASDYYKILQTYWWEKQTEIIHQTNLKLDRIRPFQHPVRRLAYLIHLLQTPQLELLWLQVFNVWNQPIQHHRKSYLRLKQTLLNVVPTFHHPYWDWHYNFEKNKCSKMIPGLGEELKTHILINTLIPLLISRNSKASQKEMWKKVEGLLDCITCPKTSKSQYLQHRFFGDHIDKDLMKKAQIIQGAYQLHHDFCLHHEASCEGCPFVVRYFNSSFHENNSDEE